MNSSHAFYPRNKNSSLWATCYLSIFATCLLIFPPPLAAGTLTLGSILLLFKILFTNNFSKRIAILLLLLSGISFFALLGSLVNNVVLYDAASSLKFLFAGLALLIGFSINLPRNKIRSIALFIFILVFLWYFSVSYLGIQISDTYRPPAPNLSAFILFFLGFLLVEYQSIVVRLCVIISIYLFSSFVDSRMLLIALPFLLVKQFKYSCTAGFKSACFIGLCVYVMSTSFDLRPVNSWSDLVRAEIFRTVINNFVDSGIPLLGSGSSAFVEKINAGMPGNITDRIEVLHSHNAYFEIFGSYGLISGLLFSCFLILIYQANKTLADRVVSYQLIFLILAMFWEAIITDSRTLYIVFLFFGLRMNASFHLLESARLHDSRSTKL